MTTETKNVIFWIKFEAVCAVVNTNKNGPLWCNFPLNDEPANVPLTKKKLSSLYFAASLEKKYMSGI